MNERVRQIERSLALLRSNDIPHLRSRLQGLQRDVDWLKAIVLLTFGAVIAGAITTITTLLVSR